MRCPCRHTALNISHYPKWFFLTATSIYRDNATIGYLVIGALTRRCITDNAAICYIVIGS